MMGAQPFGAAVGALLADRYSLERELGRGSFGIVWLARDRQVHNKAVVVKFVQAGAKSADLDWIQRKFEEEIHALSTIHHPGVVGISDAGRTETGVPYLVMDYIDGVTLRSLLQGEQLDFKRAADLLRQIGGALAAAHANGVIHRDLKPENVMVRKLVTGEEHVCLIDFGIASLKQPVPGSATVADTAETVVAGTMRYMAPEQFRGRPVRASDVYALGVIAFEMLTRRMPFEAASPVEIYEMQKREAVTDLKLLRPDLPESARQSILKALKFAEKERPTAQEFCEALARASDNSSTLILNAVEQERALDVAMAKQIPVHAPAEVIALVRRIHSEGLKAILEMDSETSLAKEDVRTRSLTLEFPMDQTGKPAPLDVVLKIVAPDFEPKSQTKVIRVPPFADSSPCSFLVTPREVGELCVNIELYLGDISLFSRVLKTHATTSDRVPVQVPKALVSVPLLVRVNNIHDLAAFFHQPLSPVNLTTLVNPPQFPTSAQVDEPVSRPKRSRMAIGAQLAVGALVCCVAITVFTKSIERRTESALPRTSNMQTPASMPMERTETKLPASKTKELEEQFRRAEQAMREHHSEVEHRAPEPVATREQKRETLPRKPDGNIMPTKPSSERPRYTELEHRAPEPVATREQKRETLPPKSHVMVPAEPSSDVVDYHGPVSGEITWTGDVQGTLLITIDNDRANVGTIRGSLPRVPCIFHLLDPEQVTIVSTPSPGRLVLKVEGVVGLTQIVIQWRVKNLAGQSEPPVK